MTEEKIYSLLKKLEGRIEYLEDQLIKQERENANLMEQLQNGDNGITLSFVGAVDKKFSEIMQTEEKIQMTVADVSDDARKQYSKYEQTAQKIETEVAKLWEEDGNNKGDISKITQTATDITSIVKKIFGEPKSISRIPGESDDKSLIYRYKETIYYYDEAEEEWKADDDGVISSMFEQTAYGFTLNGNVKISGTQIIGDDLYIGDSSASEPKMLRFNSSASISTIVGMTPQTYTALKFSAERMQLGESTYIYFGKSCTVDFSNATVTGLYAVFE